MLSDKLVRGVLSPVCLAVPLVFFGCGGDPSSASLPPGATPTADPAEDAGASALAFTQSELPPMAPGEAREVSVQVDPPGVYEVRFALLGTPLDASLSSSVVVSDSNGLARVLLTAPTTAPASFTVGATVGAVSAMATINVESSAYYATVQVEPRYAGKRTVPYWYASAHVGTTCALLGTPPPDSDVSAPGLATDQPQIGKVRVGEPVAVTVRAGRFATGCTDVSELKVGSVNLISVDVSDLPLKLDSPFLVDLTVEAVTPAWSTALEPAVQAAKRAIVGDTSDDIRALLDAMQSKATQQAGQPASDLFAERRSFGNWDESLRFPPAETGLAGMNGSEITSRVERWMQQAASAVATPCVLSGRLDPAADPTGPNRATFTPLAFAGVTDPAAAGFVARAPTEVEWSADANDTLALGGQLPWFPTRWLATLAQSAASLEQPGAESAPAALAQVLDCSGVATILVRAGSSGGENGTESYPGCDLECTRVLCEEALGLLWQRASDSLSVQLRINATAQAVLVEEPRPTRFDGRWLGNVDLVSGTTTRLEGPASGWPPDTVPGPS